MSTDPYWDPLSAATGYEAGFAAALSEHEQIGSVDLETSRFHDIGTVRWWQDNTWAADPDWQATLVPVYRRSVEVQSSEVPRTPEEPTDG